MKHFFTIKIDKNKVFNLLNDSSGRNVLYSKSNEVTLDHGQEFETALQVCASDDGAFIDIVLFKNGVEINCSEPMYEVPESPVKFYNDNEEFIVHIK